MYINIILHLLDNICYIINFIELLKYFLLRKYYLNMRCMLDLIHAVLYDKAYVVHAATF